MNSLFVVLLFCLCGYAYASKCQSKEETEYANYVVDNLCPKLKQDTGKIKSCYEGKGIMIMDYENGCDNACLEEDRDASIEDYCCFIRNMVKSGKTIADKKAVDEACFK